MKEQQNHYIPTRQLAILGSTGSIGTQALDVVKANPHLFEVYALTAGSNWKLLVDQAIEFSPEVVVIADESKYLLVKEALSKYPIKVWAGKDAIAQVVEFETVDMVLAALVGYAGLHPTIQAIKAGKAVALANKETLVVAGDLITRLAVEKRVPILPVDSEHSAIFQCLNGETSPIETIYLTASGGPFRGMSREQLNSVTVAQALKHPNWSMGNKVTIDSASLMNKGFEMIEARWLFDIAPQNIQVVIHPQSIVHSMVQFTDSSVIAQMGLPDMHLPIQYALAFPHRLPSDFPRLNLAEIHTLTFEKPDMETFRNLGFAYVAAEKGGNMACILNAANEVAVDAFLHEKVGFLQMSDIIEKTMSQATFIPHPSYQDYVSSDAEARQIAKNIIQTK